MANSTSGESVIERVVRILDAFTKGHLWMSLGELVRATGMSSSTAHRLADDLVASGLLNSSEAGDYGVGASPDGMGPMNECPDAVPKRLDA